jgi:NADH dehydrogenase
MTVLVTGGTGFLGSRVLPALLSRGHAVRALVRHAGEALPDGVEAVRGDVTDAGSLSGAMAGVEAVVHLVGIIDETPSKGVTFEKVHVDGTRNVAHAARESGVARFVHMSANGAAPDGASAYQTTKWRAEEIVRGAGFEHLVVFRPSTLFGDPGPDDPEFAKRLWETLVKPFPLLPVFGDGRYELQPIAVDTVADALAEAVTRDDLNGETLVAVGPARLTYREVLRRIAQGGGIEPKPTLTIPMPLARLGVNTVGKVGLLPISPAQFEMLVGGNVGDAAPFAAAFGDVGPAFTAEALAYLRQY